MEKKNIIPIVVGIIIVILLVGGYFWWVNFQKSKNIFNNIGDAAQKLIDNATKGVLPSLQTNPLEDKPDINPADKANPIKNIKTNPFE